ncbi:unnamed protein product [Arabidopsis thaliana]|uniref:Uncharacterized protein n=2 Tax=Arabidopsis thaliana TaxID=3702 RepID=A0A654G588_ARATH|nr:unnamed protein product [Arabidopsis thaliana]
MFTTPDEMWDEYLKFEDLQLIFGCGLATGGSAIGMGETTDARRVGDNKIDDEVFELLSQELVASPQCDIPLFPCTNPKGRVEKLHPRKRFRTSSTSNIGKLKNDEEEDPMIVVSNRIVKVIQ